MADFLHASLFNNSFKCKQSLAALPASSHIPSSTGPGPGHNAAAAAAAAIAAVKYFRMEEGEREREGTQSEPPQHKCGNWFAGRDCWPNIVWACDWGWHKHFRRIFLSKWLAVGQVAGRR